MALAISRGDKISALPDSILLHILSFLHFKTVVATSILFRRWRNLWHSAPTVDLDDALFLGKEELFIRFAYAVMLSRDLTQPILKFRLKAQHSSYAQCDVNSWVNSAIERKVETIELSFSINSAIKLSIGILTCATLVVLKLENINVDRILTVHLPALKTLCMNWVSFAKSEYREKILSGCPNIHHLQITGSSLLWLRSYPLHTRTFRRLIHVDLSHYNCNWLLILRLLNSCPLLQNLVVTKVISGTKEFDLQHNRYPVPRCLSSHLRSCTLKNFDGTEVGIQFATYIMQNTSVIKTMTICCPITSYLK
ncbi:hypothetical protein PIB30_008225 [Stylosanthes scabra]|uniref:F-box domain-containing protein n=1 Tax=Stylosanthes scabra TaxID=79078 RepID=A0ABU6Q4X3_9FABA|nr:hypothetical protein [Stylosanthes scabra]